MVLRVAVGRAGRLVWASPGFLVSEARLTVQHPVAGDIEPPFAPVRAAVEVDEVGLDGRTLHLTAPIALPAEPVADESGDAYLRLPDGGVLAVTVGGVAGETLVLADTLRRSVHGVSPQTPATLQWAAWVATIDGALTATEQRSIPWTVSATGLGALGHTAVDEVGALHVLRRPFTTGVTVGALHRHRPALADAEYRRASHQTAIDHAFDRLVTWLRADIGPGRWEDDVFNGLDFRLVHLLLAEAELAEAPERAQMIRSDARGLYRQKTERVLGVSNTGQPAAAELDLGGADESHIAYGNTTYSPRRRW